MKRVYQARKAKLKKQIRANKVARLSMSLRTRPFEEFNINLSKLQLEDELF